MIYLLACVSLVEKEDYVGKLTLRIHRTCHELIHRKLLGENLGSCSVQELKELEAQLEKSLSIIRQRKARAAYS